MSVGLYLNKEIKSFPLASASFIGFIGLTIFVFGNELSFYGPGLILLFVVQLSYLIYRNLIRYAEVFLSVIWNILITSILFLILPNGWMVSLISLTIALLDVLFKITMKIVDRHKKKAIYSSIFLFIAILGISISQANFKGQMINNFDLPLLLLVLQFSFFMISLIAYQFYMQRLLALKMLQNSIGKTITELINDNALKQLNFPIYANKTLVNIVLYSLISQGLAKESWVNCDNLSINPEDLALFIYAHNEAFNTQACLGSLCYTSDVMEPGVLIVSFQNKQQGAKQPKLKGVSKHLYQYLLSKNDVSVMVIKAEGIQYKYTL